MGAQSLAEIFEQDPELVRMVREIQKSCLDPWADGTRVVLKLPPLPVSPPATPAKTVTLSESVLGPLELKRIRRSILKLPPAWRGSVRVPRWAQRCRWA